MNSYKKVLASTVLAIVAANAAPTLAHATEAGRSFERHVSYADLDLSSEAGQAKLDQRIGRAAFRACARANDVRELRMVSSCARAARVRATAKVAQVVNGATLGG